MPFKPHNVSGQIKFWSNKINFDTNFFPQKDLIFIVVPVGDILSMLHSGKKWRKHMVVKNKLWFKKLIHTLFCLQAAIRFHKVAIITANLHIRLQNIL